MQQDTQKTNVLFLLEKDSKTEVFAYFPDDKFGNAPKDERRDCYAHVGQHSSCAPEYAKQCKQATPEQFADLKSELESIGYNLIVIN